MNLPDRFSTSAAPIGLAGRLLAPLLDRIDRGLAGGAIEVTLPDGGCRLLGGRAAGPLAVVHLHRWRALRRLATGGSAGWYRAWADGDWSSPDPVPLFELFVRNRQRLGQAGRARGPGRVLLGAYHRLRRNDRRGARRNIEAHYDLGNSFYRPWLDGTMTYSSAMFEAEGEPLETAQRRKIERLLDRLALKPGDRLLEIGCGWGALAEAAAARGVRVIGLTLSSEQKAEAEARLAAAGLHADIRLQDYRDVAERFDAVASVEMVEAVGERYWPDYLAAISRVLAPGGRAAIQLISIDEAIWASYARGADFIQRHVFPGGMLIHERRFRALAEAAGWRGAIASASVGTMPRRCAAGARVSTRRMPRDGCRIGSTPASAISGATT